MPVPSGFGGFAKKAAQIAVQQGNVRSVLSRSGGSGGYISGRGYKGFRPIPPRTQAQAAVWGNEGSIGATKYSGFGQLNLDRGFRGHAAQPYGVAPETSGSPSLADSVHEGWIHHQPHGPGSPSAPVGLGGGSPPSRPSWAMGPVVDATSRESAPWEMPSAGGAAAGDTSAIDFGRMAGMVGNMASNAMSGATSMNDTLNTTLNRPIVGRAVRAGMRGTPMGRAALFANSSLNKRAAKNAAGQNELPF